MTRSATDVRNEFLKFFRRHGHEIVPGSPLVPYDDPTLLFTNAGMNQFKDVFLATGTRPYNRAADTQPCIRAGGKHNDLDDVGHDTYHHTFFEMLGNWSFGDYFKREAIEWAWELLTDVWGLDKQRLHATYFGGDDAAGLEPDLEARDLWTEVTDIDPAHVHPGTVKDNFWEMGETGPCGPCSEIHIDLTPDKSGAELVNVGDPRVIEIWNLVFIQFNRGPDGKLSPLPAKHVDTGMGFERVCALLQGKSSNYDTDVFTPIFQAIRDVTGAPPYRGTLANVAAGGSPADQNRDREGAVVAARASRGREGKAPAQPVDPNQLMLDTSYRVIADHIRCLTFALNDGAVPDREGRGYVLRCILRRAACYSRLYMNVHEPFLYKLVPAVVETLGDAFPRLRENPDRVAEIIRQEEELFRDALDRATPLFEEATVRAFVRSASAHQMSLGGKRYLIDIETGAFKHTLPSQNPDKFYVNASTRFTVYKVPLQPLDTFSGSKISPTHVVNYCGAPPVISAEDAFKLHGTHGFPIAVTQIMAEKKGLKVDIEAFDRLMQEARERARAASSDIDLLSEALQIPKEYLTAETDDSPKYEGLQIDAQYLFGTGFLDENGTDYWTDRDLIGLVFDRTCFYAEQGGQVGDQGYIQFEGFPALRVSTTKRAGNHVVHLVDPSPLSRERHLVIGAMALLRVDTSRRATMRNHTATHVMNWALREVLGDHVQQKGSLVDPDKTRFDFSHAKPMTPEEIERVETLVNERIGENLPVHADYRPTEEARRINGLRAVFGEKYPDPVRIVASGVPIEDLVQNPDNPEWRRYPIELCGGTHCKSTGEIECFAIISEEAVAKGIRRVVGITGDAAQRGIETGADLLQRADALRRAGQEVAAGPRTGRKPSQDVAARAPRGRRDVAADGPSAETDFAARVTELQKAADEATIRVADRVKLRAAIGELQQLIKKQQKQQAAEALDVVNARIDELLRSPTKIGDTTVVVAEMPDVPIDQLKNGADRIKQKCKSAAVLFGVVQEATAETDSRGDWGARKDSRTSDVRLRDEATKGSVGIPPAATTGSAGVPPAESEPEAQARDKRSGGKALLLAAMTPDLVKKGLKAGDLVKHLAPIIAGRGGGPPTMAQAGGKSPERLPEALKAGRKWIEARL